MTPIDDKIREALRIEDEALARALEEEPSIFDLVADTLRGRLRFLNMLGVAFALIFMALGVFCAVRFFRVEGTRELIAWAVGFGWCMMAVGFVKIWYWMELSKHAVMREIKRVELEIAALAARRSSGEGGTGA